MKTLFREHRPLRGRTIVRTGSARNGAADRSLTGCGTPARGSRRREDGHSETNPKFRDSLRPSVGGHDPKETKNIRQLLGAE